MIRTQNRIKFSLRYSRLLKIVFLTGIAICSVFLNGVNAQTDKAKNNNTYFLDTDSLVGPFDSQGVTIYIEKDNVSNKWIFLPIKSSTKGYREAAAYVVTTEFQRRIGEHSLVILPVPHAKFLIKKAENNHNYELLGIVYEKFFSAAPIREIRKVRNFRNYADAIYKDFNVEHTVAMWKHLGLPIAPDSVVLELSEDNKLIRYDYYNAFQYNSEINEKCFCTTDFEISDYSCNLGTMESFAQTLRSRSNKEMLEKVISEIKVDLRKYLDKDDIYGLDMGLEYIRSKI